jgi:hypothetical protein
LSKAILSVVIISGLTLYATWVTVQTYVEKVLAQYHVSTGEQKTAISDFIVQLSDNFNQLEVTTPHPADELGKVKTDVNVKSSPSPTPKEEAAVSSVKSEDAVPAWTQGSGDKELKVDEQKKLVMSAEQFYQKKELLSDEDKMKIFSLLASRIPQNDLQQISKVVEDGITPDELTQVQGLVEKYLKPAEYKELLNIIQKY